jgi:uncharacterized protein
VAADLSDKLHCLTLWFKQHPQVAVACSGGVDSALLLYIGTQVLGQQCTGLLAESCLMSKQARTACLDFARRYNLVLQPVEVKPLKYKSFKENRKDRCYICKKQTYNMLLKYIRPKTILVDGTNSDDLNKDRPGFAALAELGVATPFLDCNISKFAIRSLSYHLGLTTWDQLSESCLATRINSGNVITTVQLQYLEKIEADLQQIGLTGCRVRLCDQTLFLTVHTGQLKQISEQNLFKRITTIGRDYEFTKVFLDLFEREGILPSLLDYIGFVDNIAPSKRFLNHFNNMSGLKSAES